LNKHQIEFRFVTGHGKRKVTIDRADAAKPGKLADALRNGGFDLPPCPDERLVLGWLTTAKPVRFVRVVRSTGWYSEFSIFVTPTTVIGKPRVPTRLANPESPHLAQFKKAGTLAGWQTEVAKSAGALSSRFILLVGAAFAAPLVPSSGSCHRACTSMLIQGPRRRLRSSWLARPMEWPPRRT
jgi:hypothetical protein